MTVQKPRGGYKPGDYHTVGHCVAGRRYRACGVADGLVDDRGRAGRRTPGLCTSTLLADLSASEVAAQLAELNIDMPVDLTRRNAASSWPSCGS